MQEQTIICPYCKKEIPLTEAITLQIRERLRLEFEEQGRKRDEHIAQREQSVQAKEAELERARETIDNTLAERLEAEKIRIETDVKQRTEDQFRIQVTDLDNAVKEKDRKLHEAQQAELDLRQRQRELEGKVEAAEIELSRKVDEERKKLRSEFEVLTRKKEDELVKREETISQRADELDAAKLQMDKEVRERVKAETQQLEKKLKQQIEEEASSELKDLRAQIVEKEGRLQKAQEAELELRKQRRQLEEDRRSFELEMNRKLDKAREQIREETARTLSEEHRLKDLDKERLISELKRQIDDMKAKAEQGSQERQGEVLELELEDILRANFALDQIEPVPRGRRGGDVLQRVRNQSGQDCGTIIWESKRTKAWNENWIEKLKDDQRESKAEIAAILTIALPDGITTFGYRSGVWVTSYGCLVGLATALRVILIQIAESNTATLGKTQKMEVLYNYLSGPTFRQKVEGIVEAFTAMKKDLDGEKRAMGRIWAKREKQIERVINNAVSMYGDMQGIIGASLPEIASLELKALAPGEDSEQDEGASEAPS